MHSHLSTALLLSALPGCFGDAAPEQPLEQAPAAITPAAGAPEDASLEVCKDSQQKVDRALKLAEKMICDVRNEDKICTQFGPFQAKFQEVRSDYPGAQPYDSETQVTRTDSRGYLCSDSTEHAGQDVLGFVDQVQSASTGGVLGIGATQGPVEEQLVLTPAFFDNRFNDCDRAAALIGLETCQNTGECQAYRGHIPTLTPSATAGAAAEAMYNTCSNDKGYPEAREAAGILTANQVANGYTGSGIFEYTGGPFESYDGSWGNGLPSGGHGTLVLRDKTTLEGYFYLGAPSESSDLTYSLPGATPIELESYCDGDVKTDDKECHGWYVIIEPNQKWDDYTWDWEASKLTVEHKNM